MAFSKRPDTDPNLIHTDSSTEYWQFRSSLVDTDEDGTVDLEQPNNLRRYLLSSTQHGATKGAAPTRGIGDRQCEQLNNANHYGSSLRALLVALLDWVRNGNPPPDSRVPRIADGTLVPPESTGFPDIPGVTYTGRYNGSGERYFGPRVSGNSGVIDDLIPAVLTVHRILVPKVDQFGNDVAGIRNPLVEAPVATLTGWNTRTPEFSAGHLCDLNGMTVPFHRTELDSLEAGDPRPSLEKLYGNHDGYVKAITDAAVALQRDRLMLEEDVLRFVFEAEESDVMR